MHFRVAGAVAVALLLTAPDCGQTADSSAAQSSNAAVPMTGAPGGNAPLPSGAPATSIPAPIAPAAATSAAPAPAAPVTTAAAPPPPTASAPPTTTPTKGGFIGVDLPPPPPGKGEVVFFRPKILQGWAVWFNVRENGKALGKLTNGVYFVTIADPGLHTYTAATENKDTLQLVVDPGATYYIAGSITMGVWVGRANISPSDQEDFIKASHELKPAKADADDLSSSGASSHSGAAAAN